MPQVNVLLGPNIPIGVVSRLKERLPEIVSLHLDVPERPEARLTPADIGVRFQHATLADILDSRVEITILCLEFPERRASIDQRTFSIREELVRVISPYISFYVYCLLTPGAWAPYVPEETFAQIRERIHSTKGVIALGVYGEEEWVVGEVVSHNRSSDIIEVRTADNAKVRSVSLYDICSVATAEV